MAVGPWSLSHQFFSVGRRLLRVPRTARRSNQSILKEINPKYSLEGLMLKLELQSFGHMMQRADWLEKTLKHGKIRARGEEVGGRGWDGGMASPAQWTWVWANSRRQWRTGKHGKLRCMGIEKSWTQLTDWSTSVLCKIGIIVACSILNIKFSSVQFSCSVMSDSLWPHGL